MTSVRLQKYIAMCGVASRRKAETLISDGKIQVNGQTVTELGTKVTPGKDQVTYDGKPIQPEERKIYVMLNKPVGVVTTVQDQFDRKTVVDLLGDIEERVYPVGRLDYNTSGLLLLTNDGAFTNQITHPSRHVPKTYVAKVKGELAFSALIQLREGLDIGNYTTAPARVDILKKTKQETTVRITIHEGKNRQIRRMFEAVDHPVVTLKRIAIGDLALGDLKKGSWRYLTDKEVKALLNQGGQTRD